MALQVFLGASSKDYELAQKVYEFLTRHGIDVFFSRESLPRLGSSDYRKQIDGALDQATHMVVVTSSADNVRSTWLEAEWGFFVNELRSGHKEGNLVTVVTATMTARDLPPSLRYYEVIPLERLEQVLNYVGNHGRPVEPGFAFASADGAAASGNEAAGPEADRPFRVADLHLPDDPLLGFVEVPAGPFLMGSDPKRDSFARTDEMPQDTVGLFTFYLARYPVTVAQFRAFTDSTAARLANPDGLTENHPVVNVSWKEALEYCSWLESTLRESDEKPDTLNKLLGRGYHLSLPSEAEWEKAARGTDGRIFPWGDSIDPNRANYRDTRLGRISIVGAFPTGGSPYGILDMSGNVWEWTRSVYKPYPYVRDDGRERLDGGNQLRVVRGGSFNDKASYLRASHRYRDFCADRNNYLGFRVALSFTLDHTTTAISGF